MVSGTRRRVAASMLAVSLGTAMVSITRMGTAAAAPCSPPIVTSRGTYTAAVVDPMVPLQGDVDATGCDIGVYYKTRSGLIAHADVHDARVFGVFNDGNTVVILSSTIRDIGDHIPNS